MIALVAVLAIGAPQRLAILPSVVDGPYGEATAVQLFEAVMRAADFRQGIELVPYNALFVEGEEPIATTVRDCGSDLPCIAGALRSARIDLGLRVIANFALDPPLFTFNLIGEDRVLGEELAELDARSISKILESGTEKLLAKYPRGGRLSIEVKPQDAALKVEPPPNGTVMAPGRYRITAARDGYLTKSVEAEVAAGIEETVRIALEPLPEEPSLVENPWLWTGVGVGVAAIVAVVLIATNPFAREPTEGIVCVTTANGMCLP